MMCEQQYQAEVMDELKQQELPKITAKDVLIYNNLMYNSAKKGSICQEVCTASETLQTSSESQNDGLESYAL